MSGEPQTRTGLNRRTLLKTIGISMGVASYGSQTSIAQEEATDVQANEWTGPRSGPARTGVTDETGPTPYAALDWKMDMDGSMYNVEPIVTDELAYLAVTSNNTPGESDGFLAAYDIETGEQQWKRTNVPTPKTPAADDSAIYLAAKVYETMDDGDGGFYALDAETGEMLWKRTDHEAWSSPIVTDDRIFAANSHGTYAFDPETGDTVWKADGITGLADDVGDALSYADGTVFASDGRALDAEDGSTEWNARPKRPTLGNPAVNDELVYFVQTDYVMGDDDTVKIQARSPDTGAIEWTFESKTKNEWDGRPAITDEYVFLIHTNGDSRLKVLDAMTGETAWTTDLVGESFSNPVVGDDTIYLGGSAMGRGLVYALDASTGDQKWSYLLDSSDLQTSPEDPTAAGEPVVSDGKLFTPTYPANATLDYKYTYYSNFFVLKSCDHQPDSDHRLPGGGTPDDGNESPQLDACIETAQNLDLDDLDVGDFLRLDASCSTGRDLTYEWDTDDDGQYDESGRSVWITVPHCESLTVTLRTTDANGATDTTSVSL